jgi:DNA-binding PadR family transcriptional regulator
MARSFQRSPLALAILALLYEAPMHPYEMQRLIKERGKDEVINVRQRASLYQTIERLLREGFIGVLETTRAENRPERTVYTLTDAGRETTLRWLREMIAIPERDFPDFPAALAQLALLTPDDTRQQLSLRAEALQREQGRVEELLRGAAAFLPRLFILETEYQLRVLEAELAWVRLLVADLADGSLTWDEVEIRNLAAEFSPVKGGA